MTRDAPAPVLILSPHPDDAVLSAWSVLAREGDVRVLNVCAGVPAPGPAPAWDRLTGARDAAERVRERRAEDAAALALIGREAVNLDYLDAQYRDAPIDRRTLGDSIRAASAGAGELWAPAGLGGHADHVAVRDAALAVERNGGPPVRLYAELPYAARRGWPEWVTGLSPRRGLDLDAWLASQLPPGTAVPGEGHELSPAAVGEKLCALREYRTQWDALAAEGTLEDPRVIRYEVSFASPSAPGGRGATPTARRDARARAAP